MTVPQESAADTVCGPNSVRSVPAASSASLPPPQSSFQLSPVSPSVPIRIADKGIKSKQHLVVVDKPVAIRVSHGVTRIGGVQTNGDFQFIGNAVTIGVRIGGLHSTGGTELGAWRRSRVGLSRGFGTGRADGHPAQRRAAAADRTDKHPTDTLTDPGPSSGRPTLPNQKK